MSLIYDGHVFEGTINICQCCVVDAKAVIDPTNTGALRGRFRQDFGLRWNKLRIAVRDIVTKQDLLALKSSGLGSAAAPGIVNSASKTEVFQRWMDLALARLVTGGDGAWTQPYIRAAFDEGTKFGQLRAGAEVTHRYAGHRADAMQTLARIELNGIAQAVSQQTTRAVANGLLVGMTPMQIVRAVWSVIEKVGRTRGDALVEMLVIRAHSEASLDVYEANGIVSVGVLPEAVAVRKLGAKDAKRKSKATTRKEVARPGSRSRGATPSQRTIQRIRRAELNIASKLGERVNVQTAGDDDVCPTCESISENGPYTVNRARSLIPAHPRCRCVFVPDDSSSTQEDSRSVAFA